MKSNLSVFAFTSVKPRTASHLLLWICLAQAGYGLTASAQQLPQTNTTTVTVHVLDPATEEAKLLPKIKQFEAGNPVVHLTLPVSDTTVQVLADSYLIVHASRRATFTIHSPEVLGIPKGTYVFPNDVQGIFQAKQPGSTIVTVSYSGPEEVCGIVALCSPNWSGYVLNQPGQTYTGVTAQWTVPTLNSNSPHGASSTWVGIDGWGNGSVLQAGTEQDFDPWFDPFGGAVYYAWFELFPSAQKFITPGPGLAGFEGSATSNKIHPGDVIQVSIVPAPGVLSPVSGEQGLWLIQFTDQTQNWSYSTRVAYTGDLSSAEWIEEATTEVSGIATLAEYDQVKFDFKDRVAINGGPLNSPNFVPAEEISMNQGGSNGSYSTPSNPDGDRDGFFITYTQSLPNQVFPPGPWIQTTSLPPALLNRFYSQTLVINEASSPLWTLNGALPPGLTFDTSQGTISGNPSQVGTYSFTVFATDTSTGAATSNQSLSIAVLPYPASTLQLNCLGVEPTAPVTTALTIDGSSAPCGVPLTLTLGVHTVLETVTGPGQPYKIAYSGACNASGQVTLTQGDAAMCSISAESLATFESACPSGQLCCESSSTGCTKCISNKFSCP